MPTKFLQFPEISIGYLYQVLDYGQTYRHEEYAVNVGSARGSVEFDLCEGFMVQLTVTSGSFEALSDLTPGSLQSLVVTRYDSPVADSQLQYIEHLSGLSELVLDSQKITDAGLSHLCALKDLKALSLSASQVTDEGINLLLPCLTSLEFLNLCATRVTDASMQSLEKLPLRFLTLGQTAISDDSFKSISAIKTLERLYLYRTAVNGSKLEDIASMDCLVELVLSETRVSSLSLSRLSLLKALTALNLYGCAHLGDEAVADLSALTCLKELVLGKTSISDSGISSLRKALPGCRIFN